MVVRINELNMAHEEHNLSLRIAVETEREKRGREGLEESIKIKKTHVLGAS